MVVGIARDERFSPNSVDKDRAILSAVVNQLHGIIVNEHDIEFYLPDASVYLSMARLPHVLELLLQKEKAGVCVLNSAAGVRQCRRSTLDALMRRHHLPVPPLDGVDGWWLKRGDTAAQTVDDVVFCADARALADAKAFFAERGITDYIVQAHVRGDLIKFYGVEGTGFFRYFYPGDDGGMKFANELQNGTPHHYFFQRQHLQATAELLSRVVGVPIYGGDAVITPNGDFWFVDFNDWPSFSRCIDEASDAIVQLLIGGQRQKIINSILGKYN